MALKNLVEQMMVVGEHANVLIANVLKASVATLRINVFLVIAISVFV